MARYWNAATVLLLQVFIMDLACFAPTDDLSLEDRFQQLTQEFVRKTLSV